MKKTFWKKTLWTSLLACGLFTAFSTAFAAPDVPLYDGKTLTQDNLSISNWGGGSIEDSTALFLFGGHSLKVTTQDLYQGAKISFLTPVALTGNNRVFQITLQRGGVTLHYVPQDASGAAPPGSPGGFGGGRGRGRRRGGSGGGQFGSPGGGQFGNRPRGGGRNTTPLIPLITKLRLEFTLADGRQTDILQTIPTTADPIAGDGWYSVNVPLSALKFGTGANAMLKSVTLGGDQYGVFFIGQMQIAADTAPAGKILQPAPAAAPAPSDGDTTPPLGGDISPAVPGGDTMPPAGDTPPPGA